MNNNVLTKDFLVEKKTNLEEALSQYENFEEIMKNQYPDLDFSLTKDNIKDEIEAIDIILNMPESNYDGLYATGVDDLVMLAEELSTKEVDLIESTAGIEDVLSESIEATKEDIELLEFISENPDKSIDELVDEAKREGLKEIAEHPIKFILSESKEDIGKAIKTIKDKIDLASQSRQMCLNKEIEYRTSKQKVCDAVKSMGNSAYNGILSPIRQVTLDTLSDIMDKINNAYKTTVKGFFKTYEKAIYEEKKVSSVIKEALSLGRTSYNANVKKRDRFDNDIKYETEKIINLSNRYPNSVLVQNYTKEAMKNLQGYQTFIRDNLEDVVWNGKSPYRKYAEFKNEVKKKIDNKIISPTKDKIADVKNFISNIDIKGGIKRAAEKAVNGIIHIQNKAMDFISDNLINSAQRNIDLSKKLNMKTIKYEKVASELGKVEQDIQKHLSALLSAEVHQPQSFDASKNPKNAEIAKHIDALKTLQPDDIVIKQTVKAYEKALKREEKAFSREEKANAKIDKKLIKEAIKVENKDLKNTEKLIKESKAKSSLLAMSSNYFDKLSNLYLGAAVKISDTKLKEISFTDNKSNKDKNPTINNDIIDTR